MSEKSLGLPFDIHGGGMDLIFPHHENEIAQSCGAHGEDKNPKIFARYWIHNAMLNMNGEKMSKSLGNIFYIRDFLDKYPGEVLRLALLSGHYRQPLNWSDDTIEQSKSILDRLYRVLKKVEDISVNLDKIDSSTSRVLDALCDDLNTSKVLAEINEIAKNLSKTDSNELKIKYKAELLFSANLMGILQDSPDDWLGIGKIQGDVASDKIENLINERNEARNSKNFQKADEIRSELNDMGIEIEDTADGTIWRSK